MDYYNYLISTPYIPSYCIYQLIPPNDVIYIQTREGDVLPFPKQLIAYSSVLQRESARIHPTHPLQVDCASAPIVAIQTDLERIHSGLSVPVEIYDEDTLKQLLLCSRALGVDLLIFAYQNEYDTYIYAKTVFTELTSFFTGINDNEITLNINEYIMNFYLIIMGARKAFLWAINDNDTENTIKQFVRYYGIHTYDFKSRMTHGTLSISTREGVDVHQLQHPHNDMYLAHLLEFGCLDPEFGNLHKPRVEYIFSVQGDAKYYITTFVCTLDHTPTIHYLQETVNRFQSAVNKLNPGWKVNLEIGAVPPLPERVTKH